MERIKERIAEIYPRMVEWRRDFHRNPELSFKEKETAQKVASILKSLGLEVRTGIGGHGLVGLLRGKGPGRTVALRSDMDALPIQDEKDCSYRSQVPGVMHACGHDGHMATLLGAAAVLIELREQWDGSILFLFQHAEELLPGGAVSMIDAGVLDGVDAIFGVHLWTPLPCGVIGIRSGELMASADSFEVEIIGKGGHGGLPHEAVDSVVIASHVIVQLQTIISRCLNPLDSGVITVGQIEAGNAFNVIAERCRFWGTVRAFKQETREAIVARMEEVIQGVCRMFGADYRFDYTWGYPPVVNEPAATDILAESAKAIVGEQGVWQIDPVMAGEDFAYYLKQRPGAFCFVGAGNTERNITAPHHHPLFDFDEEAMKIGAELWVRTAMRFLGSGKGE
ncbi:M20 family metallopeptidase [Thermoactinomyces sp. CICC 10523]|jgi:amidohydrolase|uniref:M20 metallopeptidase family protein n=1 Tax=Thermoactinomyces sp. CICC 10523 TaxID=2767428 RepID=UPI0018DE7DE4|nr:M20 family metallopeptidase [Thermoactinomyces sp. CICC 10523]MBH8597152.1 amidohydrolase [Thermoactinomyces sp. CICC 10523]